ncbi:glycerophosphodiester phosphodiesterase family protein [Eubacterium multiforme]|uniref:Glycerophosphoryl diester phosphodiesterase n=1 Tax=Eubacterium multiforme TaxID=83339 RepID=A0ABT9UW63_9FIRM|nr:glycerophosphodiester phosphodiesterase [Eubacterium multiforme]MDQ0150489.1 glycerophosphoryl diester phosphodiesterase [Eubacterium multiforme]
MKSKYKNKGILSLIKKTFNNFKFNFFACTYFEMCYRILTAFIFVPILYLIFKYFIGTEGLFTLTNKDFIKFGLSFQGIICILILLIMAFCTIFIEIGVLTYIGAKSHRGEKIKAIDGIFNVIGILKDTLNRGIIPLIIITGVIGPLTGIGLCSSLIKDYSIPPFITIELSKTIGGKILYGLIIIGLAILLFRWILSIPIVVIEKVKGKDAVKKSYVIYKKNRWKLFRAIALWAVVMSLMALILMILIMGIGFFVGDYVLGATSFASKIFLGGLLIVFYIIFVLVSIISTPLFVSFLVELYYDLRENNVKEREFKSYEDYKKNVLYKISKKYSNIFVVILTLAFAIFSGTVGYGVVFHRVINDEVAVTAHRGSSVKAPENTLSAIKLAEKEGANFAEIDVQTTKDNKTILLHDGTFKRTAGVNKTVRELTLDQIKKLDNGSFHSTKYKGEKVPTLDEVLKEAKGKIKINIELKPKGNDDPLVKNVNDIIKKYDMEDEVVISSNNFEALQEMKNINPKLKVGYIVIAAIGEFEKLNVDFFSLESSLVNSKTVYALHALGKEVHVFTINNEELAEKMIYLGVDNIITDDVPMVEAVKKELKEEDKHDYVNFFYESVLNILKYAKI